MKQQTLRDPHLELAIDRLVDSLELPLRRNAVLRALQRLRAQHLRRPTSPR